MENDQNSKELGLIDILQIMGQWAVSLVKKMTEWFLFLFFFGLKRWKIFLVVGTVAGLYSYITYKMQDTQYEANMIIRSNAVESAHMKNFLDAYSNILGNDLLGDSVIESRTGLDSIQRSQLTSLSTYYCVDENKDGVVDKVDKSGNITSSDEYVDSLNLCVSVRFEDVSILDDVKGSMIKFVDDNNFVTDCNRIRLSELEKRRAFISAEIDLLDTLQKRTYEGSDIANTMRASGSHVLVDNRKVLVYKDKIILLDLLELVEREKEIYPAPITIIEDFTIGTSAINTLLTILKKNIFISMVGAYLILFAFFLYNREKGKYLN